LKKWKILDNLEPKEGGAKTEMIRFLLGVIVGVLILLLFIYFGGGKTVKKVGEGLTETGKRMEQLEEVIKKERDEVGKDIKKRILKEEKEAPKKGQ
jgi:hypothetical protein